MSHIERILDLIKFPEGACHILMLQPRKKDGISESEKQAKSIFQLVTTKEEWLTKLGFLQEMKDGGAVGRIYTTYNPRCFRKGAFNLFNYIAQALFSGNFSFMARTKSLVVSYLTKEGSALSRDYYMIDVDTKDDVEVKRAVAMLGENYIDKFETVNGYHLIAQPFDVRCFKGLHDVKKDKYLFIEE